MAPDPRSRRSALLPWLFIASGFCGLVYELVWVRRLALVFGSTTLAISTVLAAYMAGLALGSLFFGRRADRSPRRAPFLFALLEIGIGCFGILFPFILEVVRTGYLALPWSLHLTPFFFIIQFLFVVPVIVLPTFLMGGTLPLLTAHFFQRDGSMAKSVGRLYAANTFGACLGTFAATFFLVPELGVRATEYLTAILNFTIGAIVLWQPGMIGRVTALAETAVPGAKEEPTPKVDLGALGWSAALAGFAAMSLQVFWSRMFAIAFGSSVYVFGMILLLFLLGLALGSAWVFRSARAPLELLRNALLGLAVITVLGYLWVPQLPELFMRLFPIARLSFPACVAVQFFLMGVWVIPAAICFGIAFPSAISASTHALKGAGGAVARITLWNTAGTVAGAFFTGFLLIPYLGLRATLFVAVLVPLLAVYAAVRGAVLEPMQSRPFQFVLATVFAVAGILWISFPWNTRLLMTGVGFFAPIYGDVATLRRAAGNMDLLFYRDGIATTITVEGINGERFYCSNGKTDASDAPGDMANQILLGHLPMLLHRDAKEVFMLGLGTGMSAAAVARYPISSLDIVDIETASSSAVKFFAKENRDVTADPRVHVMHADGRQVLLARSKSYDVIISDPSDVWVSGVGNLITREFYALAASRLRPGGVMVQWFHLHSLDEANVKRIVASFRSVFPNTSVWRPNVGDLIVMGTVDPVAWDYGQLQQRATATPGVMDDLLSIGMHSPLSLFGALVLQGDDLTRYLGQDPPLHEDNFPLVEFQAPRHLYLYETFAIDDSMRSYQISYLPELLNFDVVKDFTAEQYYLLGYSYWFLKRHDYAQAAMKESLRLDGTNAKRWMGLGLEYEAANQPREAQEALLKAYALDGQDLEIIQALADLLQQNAPAGEADKIYRQSLQKAPARPELNQAYADFLIRNGHQTEALPYLQAVEKAGAKPPAR